jgi:hypothetical protein
MLIRIQKDLTRINHEYERAHGGKSLQCALCEQSVGMPPIIKIDDQLYHIPCAMQVVYGVLEALSGYGPEKSHSPMETAFREAAQQRPHSLDEKS